MNRHSPLVLSLAAVLSAAGALAQAPCYEPSLGVNLNMQDDSVVTNLPLGFAFPMPGGGTTIDVDVSSNGQIFLVPNTILSSRCCSADVMAFLSDTPTIAALWTDLVPVGADNVYFNTFPGRAVFTWYQVQEFNGATTPFTLQCQLLADGSIHFFYDQFVASTAHTSLVGVTSGNGAPDPGSTNLNGGPIHTGTVATLYEFFPRSAFDLTTLSLSLIPNGQGGYRASTRQCSPSRTLAYGTGCAPLRTGSTFYELFPVTRVDLTGRSFELAPGGSGTWFITECTTSCYEPNQTNALPMGDDAFATGLALGFTASYGGVVTNTVDVCSNGFVSLVSGANANPDPTPSVAELLSDPARIGALWMDLDPSSGGTVYFDTFPGRAVVTWNSVPEYATGSLNTLQAQLLNDGRVLLSFQQVATTVFGHEALVGASPGNGAADPGGVDLTSLQPALRALNLPLIGQTFTLGVDLPATTTAGVTNIGFTQLNLDLSVILPMPRCRLLAAIDFSLALPATPPMSQSSVPIPNSTALLGGNVYFQSILLASGINPFGVVTSNGLQATIGN
jgi:hypothetical protein